MNAVIKLEAAQKDETVTYTVLQIPIERIRAFASQPRKWFDPEELLARAESMKALGQQDPVTVERIAGDPDHDYELINGESRLRSAQMAGIKTLWAAVRSVPFASKVEKHLASLVANFNRSDHTPMEISNALQVQVTEGGKSQRDISRALGMSEMWVSRYISLQNLHPEIQALMHPARSKAERLALASAFELARLPIDQQLKIFAAARCPDGTVNLQRRKVRSLKKGEQVQNIDSFQTWTYEREMRYRALHKPNPQHVAQLRAGIQEFRRLLEALR
jgi:ParB/RepB/Spo0J family partition protein